MPMEGLPGACLLCIFIFLAMLPFNYIKSNLMMPHVQLWKLMLLGAKTGGIPQQVGCANGKSSWKIERSEHTHNKNKCRQNTNEIFFFEKNLGKFQTSRNKHDLMKQNCLGDFCQGEGLPVMWPVTRPFSINLLAGKNRAQFSPCILFPFLLRKKIIMKRIGLRVFECSRSLRADAYTVSVLLP
jgi:hypothetical protein